MYSVSDDSPSLQWFSVCYQCSRKKIQTRRLPLRRVMKGFRELGPVQGARTSCLPRPLALSDGVSVFFVLSKSCSEWHEEAFDMFKCKVWWGSPTTFKKVDFRLCHTVTTVTRWRGATNKVLLFFTLVGLQVLLFRPGLRSVCFSSTRGVLTDSNNPW